MATTRYVWGQYNLSSQIGYRTRYRAATSNAGSNYTVNIGSSTTVQIGSGYSISSTTGTFSRTGISTYTWELFENLPGGYIALTGNRLVYSSGWRCAFSGTDNELISRSSATMYEAESYLEQYTYYVQGTFIKNISNSNSNAYPNDDYTGSYWYIKLGSDIIDPDKVSIPETISKNDIITIEITPSSKQTQPGNIYYNCQYNFGDGTWKDLSSNSTSTTYELKIPEGTPTVQIRVQAKDDLGFTSSTWVQSEIVSVINNTPPTAPKSISVSNVYIDQIATISISAAADEDGTIEKYIYERSVDGAQFEIFYTDLENALKTTDQIGTDWGTVAYRVKAVDDQGAEGPYVTSITYAINEGYLAIATPSYNLGDQINPFYFTFSINTVGEPASTDVKYTVLLDEEQYKVGESNFGEDINIPIDSRLLSSNKNHNILIQAQKEGYVMAEAANTFYIPGISAPTGGVIEQLQNSKGQAVLPYTLAQCVIGKDGKDVNALFEQYQENQMKVFSSTYQGTGTFGEGSPNTLVLTFEPKFAFIIKEGDAAGLMWGGSPTVGTVHIISNLNTLSWYAESAEEQYNVSETTYYYTILG